jgi:cytochrome P450
MSETKVPTGLALTPLDDTFRQDPYPVLRELREHDPIHHDTDLQRFFFTKYSDVKQILRNPEHWSDPHKSKPDSFARFLIANQGEEEEVSMLLADEPDHRRLRMLVNDIFTPRSVRNWHDRIVEIIEARLDAITEVEFDLIAEYAGPIPTVVIAEMMGIPTEHHGDFKRWSDTSVKIGFNPLPSEAEAQDGKVARASLDSFFAEQIELRKREPGPDLISQMLAAQVEGEQLTEKEIIGQCNLLLVAGNVTTTDMIGNGVKALLDHPQQLASLRAQPDLIEAALEEILRYDSPVVNSGRIAHADIKIGGCPIASGESLSVSLGAANRDPEVYSNPDSFDIERESIPHQSFGGGRHHCLGASLARLEGQEAILRLVQRFPNLRLSDKGFEYAAIPAFRGMRHCWLRTD